MFDIYRMPRHNRNVVEFVLSEMLPEHVYGYFKKNGYMTHRTSRINRRFDHIKPNVRHVGFANKDIYLIVDSVNTPAYVEIS